MEQTIQRWGNSQGIRIPKPALEAAGLSVDDRVELAASSEGLLVRKAAPKKHQSIRELFEAFYGVPFDEIPRVDPEPEADWGEPTGHETW